MSYSFWKIHFPNRNYKLARIRTFKTLYPPDIAMKLHKVAGRSSINIEVLRNYHYMCFPAFLTRRKNYPVIRDPIKLPVKEIPRFPVYINHFYYLPPACYM